MTRGKTTFDSVSITSSLWESLTMDRFPAFRDALHRAKTGMIYRCGPRVRARLQEWVKQPTDILVAYPTHDWSLDLGAWRQTPKRSYIIVSSRLASMNSRGMRRLREALGIQKKRNILYTGIDLDAFESALLIGGPESALKLIS